MRGTLLIAALLVFGLIVAGCTSPNPPAGNQSAGGQSANPSGNGGAGTQGQTQEQTQNQTEEQASGQQGDTGSAGGDTGDTGNDLAGKGYEALAALGVPLQCQMSVASEGGTFNAKVYMKGTSEVRSEGSAPEGECSDTVTIIKGKKYYVSCVGAQIMDGCDWMEFTMDDSEAAPTSGGSYQAPDYSDIPPAQITCQPWVYDSSKFTTSGNVCNLDEIMNQYKDMYKGGAGE